jgi:(1->4)-alpha-D-glucan 1-alpha-D-glucosylmutase
MPSSNHPAAARKMDENPPSSTYRVQVRPEFPLAATAEIADYLADLGVSHLYSAPLLTAAPDSQHGYDVVDHSAVSPALGGAEGLSRLHEALKAANLGLVVDIVPNHAGVAAAHTNPTWWDVPEERAGLRLLALL